MQSHYSSNTYYLSHFLFHLKNNLRLLHGIMLPDLWIIRLFPIFIIMNKSAVTILMLMSSHTSKNISPK